MVLKYLTIFILSTIIFFGLDINQKTSKINLLLHSEVYIDKNQTETLLGHRYSPNLIVWIKFFLSNTTSKTIEKVIEYANPLTSLCRILRRGHIKKQDGLLSATENRKYLSPILKIELKPNESKIFFIKSFLSYHNLKMGEIKNEQ
ncbi:MAG: hypothetical protein ACWA5P_10500 [bacterium]